MPPGIALSGSVVEAVASGDQSGIAKVMKAVSLLPTPLPVRSSAVDEDGTAASFAGQHLSLLNVPSTEEPGVALREIWWSANSDSAITYRQRVGLFTRPSVGVVVQSLLDPEVAGVMFTENPITGADERVIEASWGLGEAVVAGLVIPDHFRVDRSGHVLERKAGHKTIAVRTGAGGGTVEEKVTAELVDRLCLSDVQLEELTGLRRGVSRSTVPLATSSLPSLTERSICFSAGRLLPGVQSRTLPSPTQSWGSLRRHCGASLCLPNSSHRRSMRSPGYSNSDALSKAKLS